MALDTIRAHPLGYARGTLHNFQTLWQWGDIAGAGTGETLIANHRAHAQAASSSVFRRPAAWFAALAWPLATLICGLWWIVSFGALAALLRLRLRTPGGAVLLAFGWVWLLIIGTTAATSVPTFRFSAQALPLLWLVGSVGLVFVVQALWSALRRERRRGLAAGQ
jgi:hypothetical protein